MFMFLGQSEHLVRIMERVRVWDWDLNTTRVLQNWYKSEHRLFKEHEVLKNPGVSAQLWSLYLYLAILDTASLYTDDAMAVR